MLSALVRSTHHGRPSTERKTTATASTVGSPRSGRDRGRAAPTRPARLPGLIVSGRVGVIATLKVALEPMFDFTGLLAWDDACSYLSAQTWSLIVLDCDALPAGIDQCIASVRRRNPTTRIVCLLPPQAPHNLEGRVVDSDAIIRMPLDVSAIATHAARLFDGTLPRQQHLGRHVNNAMAYISEHYGERLRVSTMAETIGVSPGHLVHLFPAHAGWAVSEFVIRVRLEVVKILLQSTEEKLDVIAERTGFCDASHLSRMFRLCLGLRPHAFRRGATMTAPGGDDGEDPLAAAAGRGLRGEERRTR